MFARAMQVKPIMIADIPVAVSGTESIIKYDRGANIVPARHSPKPNTLYGLDVTSPPLNNHPGLGWLNTLFLAMFPPAGENFLPLS